MLVGCCKVIHHGVISQQAIRLICADLALYSLEVVCCKHTNVVMSCNAGSAPVRVNGLMARSALLCWLRHVPLPHIDRYVNDSPACQSSVSSLVSSSHEPAILSKLSNNGIYCSHGCSNIFAQCASNTGRKYAW